MCVGQEVSIREVFDELPTELAYSRSCRNTEQDLQGGEL
jgi:hypothetical protein